MKKVDLRGQVALITGAAKRIGRAVALALAEEGVHIVIHYNHSAGEADELAAELDARGVKSWRLQANFERPEEYQTLVERSVAAAGSLDILVNSASIFPPNKLADMTLESLMQNVQVNAWAPFALSRDFYQRVGHGNIVNMIDARTESYDWAHVAYLLSKHVLLQFTRMMAVQYAPGVRVNGISPGLILPPPGKDDSYLDGLTYTVPLKRHGDADDIARTVLFLVQSDFITGDVIEVDGGRHLMEYNGKPPSARGA